MNSETLVMLGVGDIMTKDETSFALVAPVMKTANVVVGQGEFPCTLRPVVTAAKSAVGDPSGSTQPSDPKIMAAAFRYAGLNVIHIAGNHIWDSGIPAIEDTIAALRDVGIAVVGGGMNIAEARKPAIIERNGTRFGFLSYNCVGPRETWANPFKPGCAYVHIVTAYEVDHPTPGANPDIYTFAEPISLKAMLDDIHNLRALCDILVVHFHKNIGFVSAKLAMYEQTISYAAIDAGADLILAEHAHILRGIEQYQGKTIFHGLGNITLGKSLATLARMDDRPLWLRQQAEKKMKEWFGLEPGQPIFAPETIIAKCNIDGKKISKVSYLPCLINEQGQPEILKHDKRGQQIFDYLDKITREADLNAQYEWEGDEVVIHTN